MKKIYKKPTAKSIVINPTAILAGSPDIPVNGPSDETPDEYGSKGGIWQWMGEEN